ncbi:hypothetical protein ABZ686_26215 [Streptomyces sp. NPDC006992]
MRPGKEWRQRRICRVLTVAVAAVALLLLIVTVVLTLGGHPAAGSSATP